MAPDPNRTPCARRLATISQALIDSTAVALYPTGSAQTRNRQVYTPISSVLKHANLIFTRPALDAMGSRVYDCGRAPGMGSTAKMINQLLAGVHIAAASEAIAFAAKQGRKTLTVGAGDLIEGRTKFLGIF